MGQARARRDVDRGPRRSAPLRRMLERLALLRRRWGNARESGPERWRILWLANRHSSRAASKRLPHTAWRYGTRPGRFRARSSAMKRHSHDTAVRSLDALHSIHQLAHEEQSTPVLTINVVGRRGIDQRRLEIESFALVR